ncbi:MAG: hypothetical protein IPQ07_11800 [Myxococcales bacterium]|nr:hypothetical protein [Myxococcales bacterium]
MRDTPTSHATTMRQISITQLEDELRTEEAVDDLERAETQEMPAVSADDDDADEPTAIYQIAPQLLVGWTDGAHWVAVA